MSQNLRPYWEFVRLSATSTPHWRWQRAGALVGAGSRPSPWTDDEETLRAAAFIRSRRAGAVDIDQPLAQAVEVFEQNGTTRWLMEAYLLARATPAAVAERVELDIRTVGIYGAIFFDVGEKFDASSWIAAHTFGMKPLTGFPAADLGALWRWVGYRHGERALDLVHAVTTGFDRHRYTEDALEEAELFVLTAQLSPNQQSERVVQLELRLQAEAAGSPAAAYHLARVSRAPARSRRCCAPGK